MPASFSCTTSSARKFSSMNEPRPAPISSFLLETRLVCGMGRPSGRRNSAVTANQSASAPTMPPSLAARTKPSHGCCSCSANEMTNTTAMAPSRPSATACMRRSCARRSKSAAVTAPSVRRLRGIPQLWRGRGEGSRRARSGILPGARGVDLLRGLLRCGSAVPTSAVWICCADFYRADLLRGLLQDRTDLQNRTCETRVTGCDSADG